MIITQLRIAINAQFLPDSGFGGVESVLVGLVAALGQLDDGSEEYIVIGPWQEPDWLKPYLGSNQHIVPGPRPPKSGESWKRALGPLRGPARWMWRKLFRPSVWPQVAVSNGFYENLGCDVIHFPSQRFVVCALPTIYNPHDLQHLHYPEFFPPSAIASRETIYRAGCHFAHTVVVGSRWVKQDIVRHYGIHPDKIQIIPWAPPTQAFQDPSAETLAVVRARYNLELPFAFYPAMMWEHKNHLRLLDALALLRKREGLIVRLVCTGHRYSGFWPRIEEHIKTLGLDDQVWFLGMVSRDDLRAIYRLSQFVVVPTLFEAASGPVFEAWQDNAPVACSTVTSLPEQVGDAALLFDPHSVEAIADAVKRMATDRHLRLELTRKGQQRLKDFDWKRTAQAYRAVYRRAARRSLMDKDRQLLSWDWMQSPQAQPTKGQE